MARLLIHDTLHLLLFRCVVGVHVAQQLLQLLGKPRGIQHVAVRIVLIDACGACQVLHLPRVLRQFLLRHEGKGAGRGCSLGQISQMFGMVEPMRIPRPVSDVWPRMLSSTDRLQRLLRRQAAHLPGVTLLVQCGLRQCALRLVLVALLLQLLQLRVPLRCCPLVTLTLGVGVIQFFLRFGQLLRQALRLVLRRMQLAPHLLVVRPRLYATG